jgi:MFS family permease
VSLTSVRSMRAWSAFHHRNYRLFWFGQLISLIGTWMQAVAQDWLVLQLTNNPFDLGLVAAVQFTPVMILGLFGGLIADHLPKRRTLLGTQSIAMTLALVLAADVITNNVQVWHIFVLAFLLGCVNAFDMPTRQSFVVEMVGREDVGNAVALNSAMFNTARVIGPAFAGLAIGVFGIAISFVLNGLSYIAVLVSLKLMRDSELHSPPRIARPTSVAGVVANLGEGLSYVRRTPIVLLAILMVGIVSTVGINFNVAVPPVAKNVLDVGATGYGFLMAAMGVGSLVAALTIATLGKPSVRVLVGGGIMLGLLEMVFAISRSFPLSLLAMFGVGFGVISMAATANTLIQLNVPDQLRGRVMSVYTTVFAGSTPIGAIGTGSVSSALGAALAVGIAGLLSTLVALAGAAYVFRSGLADHSGDSEFGSGGASEQARLIAEIANAGVPGPAAALAVPLAADSTDRLAPAGVTANVRTGP